MVVLLIAFIVGLVLNFIFNGVFGLVGALIIVGWSFQRRSKEIAELSLYLKQMNAGDTHYDIADYREGELSVLRSELSKTTLMLNTSNETLRQQQAFLYHSLSDISHQLKTPLTGMTLMNDVLLSKVGEQEKEFVIQSQAQVERLEWLVVSLLKLIQLEAKSIILKKETVQAKHLIKRALTHLELDKQLDIIGEDASLYCDINWTQEVIINILNNKNVYADTVITIEISKTRLNAFITISDDGPEISLKERERLFERFYKGENARSESVGIGLALSHEIMTQQGFKLIIKEKNSFVLSFHDEFVTS